MKLSGFSRIKWERARDLKKRGHYQEAERELKEALDEEPNHFLLKASLAELYLRQERFLEARILTQTILARDPHYSQALFILGELYFKERKFDEALQCFRQATQKDQKPYLTLRVARTLRHMEHYQEALETLDSLLIAQRDNLPALKEKALVLTRMKQWDEALSIYEEAQRLDSDDSFVRKEVYRLKGRSRQDHEMIKELKTVVRLPSRKNDAQLHGLLGQKLKKAGKIKEAADEFATARRLDPNNRYFLKQEGFCHYQRGDYPEAIQALSRVFHHDPNDYRLKATLKKMYTRINDIAGFISLLEEILKDHPHNVKLMGTLKKAKKEAHAQEIHTALS